MVIRIKFAHSHSFKLTDSYDVQSLNFLLDHIQFTLIHGPNIPGSYAILQFIALDLASITSHIHNWELFLLWLRLFILFGVISPLISSSILGTYRPGKFIFQCPIFLPFHTVHGVSYCSEYWSGLPFPSPVDHILSELSTKSCPSWVALHGMAHSFIELDKAVVHVIRLVSFLWWWFSVCLASNLRYADDTTLMAESEEELKSLLMKVKEESEKVSLKLNTHETKIMASGPITLWQIDGKTV